MNSLINKIDDILWKTGTVPGLSISEARNAILEALKSSLPEEKNIEGYESPYGWISTDENKDYKRGYNQYRSEFMEILNGGDK